MSEHGTGGFVRLGLLPPEERPLPEPVFEVAEILENALIAPEHYRLRVHAPRMAGRGQPGQFANLTVARTGELWPVLPRPMALYGWDAERGEVVFVYRVYGEGTRLLSERRPGERLELVGPLGRPFRIDPRSRTALLIGRGIGICSLTALAEQLAARGVALRVVASARRPELVLGQELFARLGAEVLAVNDLDGSSAVERLRPRIERLLADHSAGQIFVCGSNRLLQLAAQLGASHGLEVQVSLEAHMACGLGYCHGCSTGYPGLPDEAPLVCRDGPVFSCLVGASDAA